MPLRVIDRVNDVAGRALASIVVVLTLTTLFEVVSRYVFLRPTTWVYPVNIFLMTTMVSLGTGYVFLHRGHVSVDVVRRLLPPRTGAVVDLVTALFIFAFCLVVVWKGGELAVESVVAQEVARNMLLQIPIYPLKIFVVVGAVLLLLQATAKFVRDLIVARTGSVAEEAAKDER